MKKNMETPEDKETNKNALFDDIPIRITIELGSVIIDIKKLEELGEGSIIELDKLAGEPVGILANGQKIGTGEVVVIDENFGVRVVQIFTKEMLRQTEHLNENVPFRLKT